MRCRCRMLAVMLAGLTGMVMAQPVLPGRDGPRSPAVAAAPALPMPAAGTGTEAGGAPTPSVSAQRIYAGAREQLVQVRTLLQGDSSQATVGSGFLVDARGLLLTNYHVVSTVALQPQRYRLVYTTASGQEGPLELIAFDVVHDLALVRVGDGGLAEVAPLVMRGAERPLARGERIFSLGNPLDVGFAVMEGHYNGLVERSFYPNIFFGGSLSGGMSGGPALDEAGQVIGVNVATRRDGEQISFLVPAEFARQLLAQHAEAEPVGEDVYPEITRQLMEHQQALTERFMAQPWLPSPDQGYAVPVPQEIFMRCWGRSTSDEDKGMRVRRSDCSMDTQIFISERNRLGGIRMQHRWFDGRLIGPWRFAQQYSERFEGQIFSSWRFGQRGETPRQCHERFVEQAGLTMRVVACLDAYKKLEGLYDLRLLVASVNQPEQGVQSVFSVSAVSYDNAMRLMHHFLEGFAWKG
ncbi:serine protease [Corticibacter populi]|uniref:Serine protease n=2 Tax=Corticibacter populi TaxID=1550736 RepID=A0A3M6QPX4_9BURK|nr:serine protease [Corticibacter populi]